MENEGKNINIYIDNDDGSNDVNETAIEQPQFQHPSYRRKYKKPEYIVDAEQEVRNRQRPTNSLLWVNSVFCFPRNIAQVSEVVCWFIVGGVISQVINSLIFMGWVNVYFWVFLLTVVVLVGGSYYFLINTNITDTIYRNIQMRYFLFIVGFSMPLLIRFLGVLTNAI